MSKTLPKGIFQCGQQLRVSAPLYQALQSMAQEQGCEIGQIKTPMDYLEATLAIMPEDLLDQLEQIYDRSANKFNDD